ncbi:MAG: AfsR/SARP family transcriptional regulator [Actinomycetota bacterium]
MLKEVEAGSVPYRILLFKRFEGFGPGLAAVAQESPKLRELLCYLLVFRDRLHHREILASALWPESTSVQSRKYLRQALWRLRALTDSDAVPLLRAENEWVGVDTTCLWIDADEMEQQFMAVRTTPGEAISDEEAGSLRDAVALYRGDLLEGWYQDWCVSERERLKAIYLGMMDKLLAFSERHSRIEEGLSTAERILRHNPTSERTYVRLMRLYYLAGDRTTALRQFSLCNTVLRDELGIEPAEQTRRVYEQIRDDRGVEAVAGLGRLVRAKPESSANGGQFPPKGAEGIYTALERLRQSLADAVLVLDQSMRELLQQGPDAV